MEGKYSKVLKRTAERIVNFSRNTKKSVGKLTSVVAIELRIGQLDEAKEDYRKAWKEWQDASDDVEDSTYEPEFDNDYYDSIDDLFVQARAELQLMRDALLPAAAAVAQNGAAIQAPNAPAATLRVPTIQPPSFSGEWEEWVSFRDMFTAIVIRNAALTNTHRLHLLRVACTGKAAEEISGIELAEGNFDTAWAALKKKFENERLLVFRLIEKMLSLSAMKRENAGELSQLLNGTNNCIRALKVLGRETDHLDDVLVVLTVTKLDVSTRTAWERQQGASKVMPTFVQLDEFLHGILGSLEALKHMGGSAGALSESGRGNTYQPRRSAHAHIVATTAGGRQCVVCKGAHGIYNCPTFQARSVAERRAIVGENRLCFRCISSDKHRAQACVSRFNCRICNQNHHTLLHIVESGGGAPTATAHSSGAAAASRSSGGAAAAAGSSVAAAADGPRKNPFDGPTRAGVSMCTTVAISDPRETLLPTAWVLVRTMDGRTSKLRALVDQGSQVSLITRQAVQRLGMRWQPTDICLSGVAEAATSRTYGSVRFTATACNKTGQSLDVCALVLSTITADLPTTTVARSSHAALSGLQLADERYWQTGRIDLLLGAAVMAEILQAGMRKADGLVAQETALGWMVSGSAAMRPIVSASLTYSPMQLDELLRRFWEQEEMQRKPLMSADDEACEHIYNSTTIRNEDGRYVVELPFRQGGRELGDSCRGAVRRLMQMEKRGMEHMKMYEGYKKFMNAYLDLGHMERVPDDEIHAQPHCYLPHHAVFKPDSSTTKLRVVFDATAATSNGTGLNALLHTGPRLQETLAAILMRWRSHKVCFSADVEKMYRQILVKQEHQDYQRIVWRNDASQTIEHYRLKTVTYGTASAPYMAIKTLQRLANDEKMRFPSAAKVAQEDFYVDDCLSGAGSVEEAVELKNELLELMSAGGLRLLKWSSNSSELLASLPDEYIECRAPLVLDDDESTKALGVRWHPVSDEFAYRVTAADTNSATTKRTLLSEISKLHDPLGLLAPVIITAKTLMQSLWLLGVNWDEILPSDIVEQWHTFQRELPLLEELRLQRWYGHSPTLHSTLELHGFSDASTVAYAACVYSRVQRSDGSVVVTLLAAKTKVAPIQQQSVPRLELNGAVLLSRLMVQCRQAMRCEEVDVFAWTDSTIVLAWLRQHANMWQTYVANRVSEIQTSIVMRWQHVPGVENPADVASRGIMPSELQRHPLWWSGPQWLHEARENWPRQKEVVADESLMEEKAKKVVSNVVQTRKSMFELAHQVSSWRRLLRVTAYCRKWLRPHSGKELTAKEIEEARFLWLRNAQKNEFGDVAELLDDTSTLRRLRLQKLSPFVDANGLMRVGGRLVNANLSYDEAHPVLLGSKDVIAELLIRDAHERVFHSGPQATSAHLHQRYWLLSERRKVRSVVHKCVTCTKARPLTLTQRMGNLPAARVRPSRPFLHTAVDYAGPIWSRTAKGRGHKAHKSWIAVFVCLCSKAVHLELVSDLSAATFIAAFRRFTSRRGLCTDIYCDNGTNFVGADRELRQKLTICLRDEEWRGILAENGTVFHFAPPGSPHFNGLAEATVKMAKAAMTKTIGEHTLTFEEMATFLTQVEAALNSRPLCVASTAGGDFNVLTPGHFLTGQPLTAVPEPNVMDVTVSASNRWLMIQQMSQHFWQRWRREYLHQLQSRKKWSMSKRDVQPGDVVIVQDDAKHSTCWKMGRVTETHPGADGRVRVATVKTATAMLKRAVAKLCLLPVEHDDD